MTAYLQELRQLVGHRPLIVAGATVMVTNELGELLLQLRSDTGTWGLPGGATEFGETLEETAARELQEETGLQAERFDLIGVYSGPDFFCIYPNGDELYSVVVLYQAASVTGTLSMNDGESIELAYFPLDNLPPLESRTAKLIEHWIAKTNTEDLHA
jgi:ADP-ribose pyrophosphatase YjhB (NUDIX family)